MKKLAKILVIFVLISIVIVTAVACDKKDDQGRIILKVPQVTVSGNAISWKAVRNADKYGVVEEGQDEVVQENENTSFVVNKANAVKVRAISESDEYASSDYSAWINITEVTRRGTPTGLVATPLESGAVKLTWDAVPDTSSYSIKIKFNGKTTATLNATTNEYQVGIDEFSSAGAYQFEVIANGGDGVHDSLPSDSVAYTHKATLADPTNVTMSKGGIIKFTKVDNANKYRARMVDVATEQTVEEISNLTIGSTEVTLDVKKFTVTTPGKYYYQVKSSRDVTSGYYNDSNWVNVNFFDQAGVRADLAVLPAPTEFRLDEDGKTLRWNAVEGALKYTIKMVSNTKTYIAETDKTEYDLSTNSDMTSKSIGGKTVEITIYTKEDFEKGFLAGNIAGAEEGKKIQYHYVKTPEKLTGTEIYSITSLPELMYIATEPNAQYKLNADINVESGFIFGITDEFGGTFDGNNRNINNFNIIGREGESALSLFGNIKSGGVVKNLNLLQNKIDVTNDTVKSAALVAITNHGTIENITATATIKIDGRVGGIVVENNGTIKGCNADFEITSFNIGAGIAAINNSEIVNSFIYATVIKTQSISTSSEQVNCYVGGIAGINNQNITGSGVADNTKLYGTAQGISAKSYVGGMAGYMNSGEVTNSYTMKMSNIESAHSGNQGVSYAGGFIGYLKGGKVDTVYNTGGKIISQTYAAGFVAYMGENAILTNGFVDYATIQGKSQASVVSQANGSISNFYRGRYNTADTVNSGSNEGVTVVQDRAQMNNPEVVKINGFMRNDKVQTGLLVLSGVPYIGSEFVFNKGTIKYQVDREAYGIVYYGTEVITEPTIKVGKENKGYYADIYTVGGFNITRIMQVA